MKIKQVLLDWKWYEKSEGNVILCECHGGYIDM